MARETKLRTRQQEGLTEVMVLVTHPMETGQRKDKQTKKPVPAHFIQELTLEHNGKKAATVNMGIGVSENPLVTFRLKNAKNGDKLKATWTDNKGEKGSVEAVVDV